MEKTTARGLRRMPVTVLAFGAGAAVALGATSFAASATPTTSAPKTVHPVAAATPCSLPQNLTGKGKHDRGPRPTVMNIDSATKSNPYYRDTLWTGNNLQLTVMSIRRHDDIGLEMHPKLDQFIRIESGTGVAKMGPAKGKLTYVRKVNKNSVVIIPAGAWHDVINTGRTPLKLYSIYAPPNHPRATLHRTKKDGANDPLEKLKCNQDVE